jgi:hypothetical protein
VGNRQIRASICGGEFVVKVPANHRQPWKPSDDRLLKELIRENTPTRVMGIKLERTPEAVQQHANQIGLSTKPVNQRPNKRNNRR